MATMHFQMESKRRNIQKELQQVAMDIADPIVKQRLCSNDNGLELGHILNRCSEILKEVEMPKEESIDAGIFASITTTVTRALHQQTTEQQRGRAGEFIVALRSLHVHSLNAQQDGRNNPLAFQWEELAETAGRFMKDIPGVSCMHGPMQTFAKERKAFVRQVRTALAAEVRPEELVGRTAGGSDAQATDKNMEIMWSVLRAEGPSDGKYPSVPVAELVCNRLSYAQTVENLFTLGFLIRDGRVILTQNKEFGYMVEAVLIPPIQEGETAKKDSRQMVMTMHMDDWETMKKLVQENEELMPHRLQQEADERVFEAPPAAAVAAAVAAAGSSAAAAKTAAAVAKTAAAAAKAATPKITDSQPLSHTHTPSKKRPHLNPPASHEKEQTSTKVPKVQPSSTACPQTTTASQPPLQPQQASSQTQQPHPLSITRRQPILPAQQPQPLPASAKTSKLQTASETRTEAGPAAQLLQQEPPLVVPSTAPISKSPVAALSAASTHSGPPSVGRDGCGSSSSEEGPGDRTQVDVLGLQQPSRDSLMGPTRDTPFKPAPHLAPRVQQQQPPSAPVSHADELGGRKKRSATQCSSESSSGVAGLQAGGGDFITIDSKDDDEDEIEVPGRRQGGDSQVVDLTLESDGEDEATREVASKAGERVIEEMQWVGIQETKASLRRKQTPLVPRVKKEISGVPKKQKQGVGTKK